MPESPDYYRGAREELEEFYRNVGLGAIAESAIWDRIRKSESDMSAPIEPLPRGKPLVYEDPSPCPDCASVWSLVEECEKALKGIAGLRSSTDATYGDAYESMFKHRGRAAWDAISSAIAILAAARQKRVA